MLLPTLVQHDWPRAAVPGADVAAALRDDDYDPRRVRCAMGDA
jgi:hypothetical protein